MRAPKCARTRAHWPGPAHWAHVPAKVHAERDNVGPASARAQLGERFSSLKLPMRSFCIQAAGPLFIARSLAGQTPSRSAGQPAWRSAAAAGQDSLHNGRSLARSFEPRQSLVGGRPVLRFVCSRGLLSNELSLACSAGLAFCRPESEDQASERANKQLADEREKERARGARERDTSFSGRQS